MNRRQKRDFIQTAKKKGLSEEMAKTYLSTLESSVSSKILPTQFEEGEKALLNVEKIVNRKGYDVLNPKYREFVESNAGKVFTVHIERPSVLSLKESPEWIFWCGDLMRA